MLVEVHGASNPFKLFSYYRHADDDDLQGLSQITQILSTDMDQAWVVAMDANMNQLEGICFDTMTEIGGCCRAHAGHNSSRFPIDGIWSSQDLLAVNAFSEQPGDVVIHWLRYIGRFRPKNLKVNSSGLPTPGSWPRTLKTVSWKHGPSVALLKASGTRLSVTWTRLGKFGVKTLKLGLLVTESWTKVSPKDLEDQLVKPRLAHMLLHQISLLVKDNSADGSEDSLRPTGAALRAARSMTGSAKSSAPQKMRRCLRSKRCAKEPLV